MAAPFSTQMFKKKQIFCIDLYIQYIYFTETPLYNR